MSRRRGKIRMEVAAIEAALLARLLADLGELLTPADDAVPDPEGETDPVLARLNPAGYRDDLDAQREFRALTSGALDAERTERFALCRADLELAGDGGGTIELDDDGGDRWLRTLNELRLALGTRLGVTEDDEPSEPDADTPADGQELYHWLTAVQDSLVNALMR